MRNRVDHLCNFAIAQTLRLFRHPFKRFREGFFLKVKNSNFTIERRIRHSRLLLPLNLGDWIQYWIFMDGAYELELVDFLRPYVQGKVFFDIGANVGNYTLTLAKDATKIFSFEASPSNANILKGFIKRTQLSNIELINMAVKDKSGDTISIFISPDTTGNYSQFLDYGHGSEAVTSISLDDFIAKRNIDKVAVIKIDIEGGEFDAIRGAEKLINRDHPLLLVEFNSILADHAGWKLQDLYDYIVSFGYKAYELKKRKIIEFDFSKLQESNIAPNIIFSPRTDLK